MCYLILTCDTDSKILTKIHSLILQFNDIIWTANWWVQKERSVVNFKVRLPTAFSCRSQWPRGLRRRSAAARLLRSWVRILPGAWMFVCCVCCVLSGRGLCDDLITRPEESCQLWWVVVCDLETSIMRRPWPALGCSATGKKKQLSLKTLYTKHLLWQRQRPELYSVEWQNNKWRNGNDLKRRDLDLIEVLLSWRC